MYFDPGFGGMLLQVVVAIVAMGGAILFSVRRKIKNAFRKDSNNIKKTTKLTSNATNNDAIDTLTETKKKD